MSEVLDYRGLKCPQPVLKTAISVVKFKKGTTIEVMADCTSFPDDIQKWATKTGAVLVGIADEGSYKKATIQL